MMNSTPKQLEYLVLDAGVLIKGAGYDYMRKTKQVVTVEEVLNEIKDSKSRELLNKLPYEIVVKYPSQEAMTTGMLSVGFLMIFHTVVSYVSFLLLHSGRLRKKDRRFFSIE